MSRMFPKHIPHKLHVVTLLGSGIRRPFWEKRTLRKLGLTQRYKTVILKNTPSVNKDLDMIKTLIEVRPLVIKETEETVKDEATERRVDLFKVTAGGGDLKLLSSPFLSPTGEFNMSAYENYVNNFSVDDFEDVLNKNPELGAEVLNHDYTLEEEKKITDKGEKIALYFKKQTWHNTKADIQKFNSRTVSKY